MKDFDEHALLPRYHFEEHEPERAIVYSESMTEADRAYARRFVPFLFRHYIRQAPSLPVAVNPELDRGASE